MTARLDYGMEAGIVSIVMNDPDRGNALGPEMIRALEDAWHRFEHDGDARVAILTGAGERHFCTGAAVGDLRVGAGTLSRQRNRKVNRFTPRMADVTKPVICAVNGLVNGGGLHFVADCDIVIATQSAAFMDTHVSVGQVSALESIGIVRRAGVGSALLLGLTGRSYRMPAERAYQLGMIDLMEPDCVSLESKAYEIAEAIARNSPQAVALTKQAIWGATEYNDPQAAEIGWELVMRHWTHPDFTEGPQAFAERRAPVWTISSDS